MAASQIITTPSLLETVGELAGLTAERHAGLYEEAAYRLLQQLGVAVPSASRIERLMALAAIAFDPDVDREAAMVCTFAARDELFELGHALTGIGETAAAFHSPPCEVVVAALDLDPDRNPQDSRRALRHAQDADGLAGLTLALYDPDLLLEAARFAANPVVIEWPQDGGDPRPAA